MKKGILIISLLFSLRSLSQEIELIPGIHMLPPKGAIKLDQQQLKAFVHEEKYPRHLTKSKPPNIYKVDDMLVGVYDWQGNFTVSLEKSKADWDKRYKQNSNYRSFINHINNYDVFVETRKSGNSLITIFFAISSSHKLLLQTVIVYHETGHAKAFETLNEMLNNLRFTDNPEPKDTINLK